MQWLSYTYLFIRMKLNHVAYGIPYEALMDDMNLDRKRRELIDTAAKALDKARMIRYNVQTGDLNSTGNNTIHTILIHDKAYKADNKLFLQIWAELPVTFT